MSPRQFAYAAVKRLLPRRFRLAYEDRLRALLYLPFAGRKHRCNVCGTGLARFMKTPDDFQCPRCGSLTRNRRLLALLESEYLKQGISVLDFSPSRPLYRKLKAMPAIHYVATDYAGEFLADEHYDITMLPIADGTFDLILCFHVLEHVLDDRAAFSELHRVLRPGGRCLIQTPFKDGEIDEDPAVTTPAGRRARFGQEDHVRNYSVDGLAGRARDAGFTVSARRFTEGAGNYHGLSPSEVVVVAERQIG